MSVTINFNWSLLDRATLFDILYSIKDKIVDSPLTVEQLHQRLTYQIKKFIPIKFKKIINNTVRPGQVYIGGSYYSAYDEEQKKCIEINFNYHKFSDAIKLTTRRFARICIIFADTILHEVIHMRQHRRREWKSLPEFPSTARRTKQRETQKYLGCLDEIDAYSFNIACELCDEYNGNNAKITRHLNKSQKNSNNSQSSYLMYLKAFEHDHNHVVIKKLKKKIVGYINQAAIGKPYRNSDWIGH